MLLYLYVQDELSYDQYHKDKARLYRVRMDLNIEDQTYKWATTPGILAPTLKRDYPEAALTTRIRSLGKKVIKTENHQFYQEDMYYADSSVFQMLTFTPVAGKLPQALVRPKTIVLTQKLAKKLFQSPGKALGKSVIIGNNVSYTVTAVIKDIPQNSHFKPRAIVSLSTLYKTHTKQFSNWRSNRFITYLKLKKENTPQQAEASLNKIYHTHIKFKGSKAGKNTKVMHLTPVVDIHLHSQLDNDYADTGSAGIIYIFMVIGVLILLIACTNYMNLATARSVERAKEVGIRKVVGSHRRQLVYQFLAEAIVCSTLAFIVSLSFTELLLPFFNQLADKALSVNYISQPQIILTFLGISLFTGLISGSYPSFVLSGFKPFQVLKGKFSHSRQGNVLRKGLVIFQFSISIVMIIGTWVVYQQLQFIRDKHLGFDKDRMLHLTFMDIKESKKYPVLKQELLKNPAIKAVAGASFGMNDDANITSMSVKSSNGSWVTSSIQRYAISSNYISVMGMHLTKGRNFNAKTTSDYSRSVIINEAFARKYGWKNPIGKQIGYELDATGQPTKKAFVIGVIGDFHVESLYKPIEPVMMWFAPANKGTMYNVFVKVQTKHLAKSLTFVKKTWETLQPQYPYQGEFLNQRFARAYAADQRRGQIFLIFSGLAVFIACLGLFGLASFTTHQRTKEIGIRKVLGASGSQMMVLLSRGFVRLVVIASFIAFPLAYYLMNQWLQNFAYRTSLHWSVFVGAGLATFVIALFTTSFQSLKTAQVNPAEILKDE